MCHHNINGGTQISLLGNYLQRGVCISISAMIKLAHGGSATRGATLSSLSQIVPANFHRMTLFLLKLMLGGQIKDNAHSTSSYLYPKSVIFTWQNLSFQLLLRLKGRYDRYQRFNVF